MGSEKGAKDDFKSKILGNPPIVEYWMQKRKNLSRFEAVRKKAYIEFLEAQGAH